MNPLEIVLAALPGTLAEALSKLVGKLVEFRDATGAIPEPRLDELYSWIAEQANHAVSPEVIAGAVMELLAIMQGRNWGPPNDGAGGVA
jgi:hypothetical protein